LVLQPPLNPMPRLDPLSHRSMGLRTHQNGFPSDVRAFLRALSTNLRCVTHVRVNPEIRIAILRFSSDKFFRPERKLMFVGNRNNALLANAIMRGDRSSEAQ
jgi:hypothetical protein